MSDDGKVLNTDDYYPFGKTMPGRSYNIGFDYNLYKFAGKELDAEAFVK